MIKCVVFFFWGGGATCVLLRSCLPPHLPTYTILYSKICYQQRVPLVGVTSTLFFMQQEEKQIYLLDGRTTKKRTTKNHKTKANDSSYAKSIDLFFLLSTSLKKRKRVWVRPCLSVRFFNFFFSKFIMKCIQIYFILFFN